MEGYHRYSPVPALPGISEVVQHRLYNQYKSNSCSLSLENMFIFLKLLRPRSHSFIYWNSFISCNVAIQESLGIICCFKVFWDQSQLQDTIKLI